MEDLAKNFEHIKGWGIDADPDNEPTYPMKHWTGDDHRRLNYERPTLQVPDVEVLHSNERPTLSAVFGTPNPPTRLSGKLRRLAFKYSEGKWWHWLALLAADRVNVYEGIIEDLKSGHIPNIPAERGWKMELKYNKKRFAQRIIVGAAITAGIVLWLRSGDDEEDD